MVSMESAALSEGLPPTSTKNKGLRNIVVADTKVSSIDTKNRRILYRGYDILDLVNHSTFEETAYLLLYDKLPTSGELDDFTQSLIESRTLPESVINSMRSRSTQASPMDVLQSAISELPDYDLDDMLQDYEEEASIRRAISIIAKFPTIIAVWDRIRKSQVILEPIKGGSHSANFLYMLQGEEPTKQVERIFDICLILHAEHSFNASTFASRVIASTRAHMYACINGAVGALSGELHGGANIQVMEMLLEIAEPYNAKKWVYDTLERGGKIMGMGHAVYRAIDPRADVLSRLSKKIAEERNTKWYGITEQVEQATKRYMKEKKKAAVYPNVDLYTASLYYSMKIPMDLNTPIFAMARAAGWSAHIIEEKLSQAAKSVLYRPKADYMGKKCGPMGCEYVPIKNRNQDFKPCPSYEWKR